MTRTKALAALLGTLLLASCDQNRVQEIFAPELGGRIKFFNFGLNSPSVNFYADDAKMTAISSATGLESTLGVAYGSVSSGGYYSSILPGDHAITARISAAVDKNLIINTTNATIEQGKSYSYYMSGFYNTGAKTSDGFIVEDDYDAEIDFTVAYVRFVHGSPNAAPLQLFARDAVTLTETPVGASIAYKGAGAFVALPPAVYDLGARFVGVGTNAISRTTVSFAAGRVYTISARGDITVVSTTATNRPFLDNTANR
jgi:hypothetical protein